MLKFCFTLLLTMRQHVYGKEAVKRGPDEWDARACVEGDYSWAEQQPDNDLGKVTETPMRLLDTPTVDPLFFCYCDCKRRLSD